jgi:integrase/recombinase XerD
MAESMKTKGRKLPNVFYKEELVKVFDNIDDPKIIMGTFLTFFCALRNGEVCNLKWKDIDLRSKRLKVVQGKGYKDGYVKISNKCIPILKKWRELNGSEEYFLPSDSNKYNHMRPRAFLIRFKNALRKAGLEIPTGRNAGGAMQHQYKVHTLRHSRCTHLLSNGIPIHKVRSFMRHERLETTLTYTWITNPELDEMVEKADNPSKGEIAYGENLAPNQTDPIMVAKMKLVNGEITKRRFKELVELLNTPLSV